MGCVISGQCSCGLEQVCTHVHVTLHITKYASLPVSAVRGALFTILAITVPNHSSASAGKPATVTWTSRRQSVGTPQWLQLSHCHLLFKTMCKSKQWRTKSSMTVMVANALTHLDGQAFDTNSTSIWRIVMTMHVK